MEEEGLGKAMGRAVPIRRRLPRRMLHHSQRRFLLVFDVRHRRLPEGRIPFHQCSKGFQVILWTFFLMKPFQVLPSLISCCKVQEGCQEQDGVEEGGMGPVFLYPFLLCEGCKTEKTNKQTNTKKKVKKKGHANNRKE